MPRVLVSNDDGYRAEGIRSLVRALSTWSDVSVVAPDRERSGSGHAISLDRPLRLRPLEDSSEPGKWFLVDGTPTDCVNLGLHVLFEDQKPDVVVSGINHGVNLGNDVTYSGTVGGALEAQSYDVPSFAMSQRTDGEFSFTKTAEVASELVKTSLEEGGLVAAALRSKADRSPLLNVNFPVGEIGRLEITKLGRRTYRDAVAPRNDPRGRAYFWIAGSPDWNAAEGTDVGAVQRGRISLTPLSGDLTEYEQIDDLRSVLA